MIKTYFFTTLAIVCFALSAHAQSVIINEIMSSNSRFLDEDQEAPDWIELYNSGVDPVNLDGWFISDRIDSLNKWSFPSVIINPAQTLLIFASGKDRKNSSFVKTIIDWGDQWQYKVGSSDIPSHWNTTDLDDSNWDTGPSGFGYGDEDDATLTDSETLSVYVRKTFQIEDPNNVQSMVLHVDFDDGFVAYLNGIEVARANLGSEGSTTAWDQPADNFTEPNITQGLSPQAFYIENFSELITAGENLLAIQVHNFSSTSSDLTLIPFLSLGFNSEEIIGIQPPEILNLKDGMLHTNFKISADGESIVLSKPDLSMADKVDSIPLDEDISYGRQPDGTGNFFYFMESTPNELNTSKAYTGKSNGNITFSQAAGVYQESFELKLSTTQVASIYYTTDGTNPTISSTKYTTPITISTTKVIKAALLSDNLLPSEARAQSYIILTRALTLPVISISTDPYNFFDEDYGIMASGPNAENSFPYFGSNFWNDWERPIHFEYFDEEGLLTYQSNAGAKIFGGWSRGNDQKSLAIFARKEYGNNSFDYPFFKTKTMHSYQSFVLRNSGNDWNDTGFRDAMSTTLVSNTDLELQAFQPVMLYINGAYWGIINMREKVNEDYLANNIAGVNSDKVDILTNSAEVVEGSSEDFMVMYNFIADNDLSVASNYEKVKTWMDVDNFMEYQVAQIYYDNRDWPGNNIKYWKTQKENGRWRWILYDTDFGFSRFEDDAYNRNTIEFATDPYGSGWPNPAWSTLLLRKLLENDSFKNTISNRFADRLNQEFRSDAVIETIDSIQNLIADEMPHHIDRWQHIQEWDYRVERMRLFAEERPEYLRDHIIEEFNISGQYLLSLENPNPEQGYIQVNSLIINENNWSGYYFKGVAITLTAHAKPGYRFKEWVGVDDKLAAINPTFNESNTIIAIFEETDSEHETIVINEINYNSSEVANAGDWIELFNSSSQSIDLSGWSIMDNEPLNAYTIPNGTSIAPHAYLVLVKDFEDFKAVHPSVENKQGELSFGLSSSFETIKLYDRNNDLRDVVYYESESPWPESPNGGGSTLSLINPYQDNTKIINWYASHATNGTPGAKNELATEVQQQASNPVVNLQLSAYPNPASEQTNIQFNMDEAAHVKVEILDYKGASINVLHNELTTTGMHSVVWNTNENGAYLTNGLYLVKVSYNYSNFSTIKILIAR